MGKKSGSQSTPQGGGAGTSGAETETNYDMMVRACKEATQEVRDRVTAAEEVIDALQTAITIHTSEIAELKQQMHALRRNGNGSTASGNAGNQSGNNGLHPDQMMNEMRWRSRRGI